MGTPNPPEVFTSDVFSTIVRKIGSYYIIMKIIYILTLIIYGNKRIPIREHSRKQEWTREE